MTTKDFTMTILVDQSPKQVFDAICNPQTWWSGELEGNAKGLNDEFTYRYKDFHMSRQRVVEFVPDKKVVWEVIESNINYVADKQEWTGTKIMFEITIEGHRTELRFTHLGLHPQIECFDSCSSTWSKILQLSLFSLITTGRTEKLVLA